MESLSNEMILTHLGEDQSQYLNAVVPPVFLTSLHIFKSTKDFNELRKDDAFFYGRDGLGNPTVAILEKKLAALEKGYGALAFSSGMAACSSAILACCRSGGHVISLCNAYPPSQEIFDCYLKEHFQIDVTYWNGKSLNELESLIRDNTQLIMIESPASFVFSVVDIEGVAEVAHRHGIRTYMDNTYCTPLFQNPLDMGIDIVMHTLSKYIGGHSDIIGGALVVKDRDLYYYLRDIVRTLFGGILGPMEGWLALRGLRSMPVRLKQHQESAMQVAQFLEKHPRVKQVNYPGLPSHPQADLIRKQQKGSNGLMSFLINGTAEEAEAVVDKLKVFEIGCSWGGFESLAICPLVDYTKEQLAALDMTEDYAGLIRIHVGLEGADTLIEDLRQALETE